MTKFLVDEDVNQKAIRAIPANNKGFDVKYPEHGFKGFKDKPVRDIAILERRVLVTCDKDFARYKLKPGEIPDGVLWIRPSPRVSQKRVGELLSRFCQLIQQTFPNDPYNFQGKIFEIRDDGVEIYNDTGSDTYTF